MAFFGLSPHTIEAGGQAVKTHGGGIVLTRFLLPFHRLEKEEPVRLEDRNSIVQFPRHTGAGCPKKGCLFCLSCSRGRF